MAAARTATSKGRTVKRSGAGSARTPSAPGPRRRSGAGQAGPPPRARRTLVASRASLRGVRDLEPHHVDILSLAVMAAGVFLGGVAYGVWAGGALGNGLLGVLQTLVGRLAYAVPVGLMLGGARVLVRDTHLAPAMRPLRTGTLTLALALALAFAAGTLGLVPGHEPSLGYWSGSILQRRGGVLGALEFFIAGHLLGQAGTDILTLFMLAAGLILLSGATFASVVNESRRRTSGVLRRERGVGSATRRAELRARRLRRASDEEPPAVPISEADGESLAGKAAENRSATFEGPSDADGSHNWDTEAGDAPGARHRPHHSVSTNPFDSSPTDEFAAIVPAEFEDYVAFGDHDAGEGGPPTLAQHDHQLTDSEAGSDAGEAGPHRPVSPDELTPGGRYRASVTDDPGFVWTVPSTSCLVRSVGEAAKPDTTGLAQTARTLIEALGHFSIEGKIVGQVSGPHITRYEIRLAPGTKMSKVANLKDDLAYALAATDIRILAPIPGKTAVGVEVPNARRRIVHLGDVFEQAPADFSPLAVWLGKDISGKAVGADLAKMPHLLVAGTTGSGKSACVNAMLASILLRATPHEVRLVLVDPKQVELNHYEAIPHLLTPVITSPRMAANALANLVREMEQRYGMMSLARTRSLPELNKARASRDEPPLPYILCVIDELADLMMVAPADVEDSIIRLAQKARAVGIHLVLATQSPRVDVITGMIKANVPSRIAFAVSSQTDSRVILDQNGAESLLGQGDMLFSPVGINKLQRIQGAYIDERQIAEITDAWRRQGAPELREEMLQETPEETEEDQSSTEDAFDPDEDPLLEEAIGLVAAMGTASTSMLQRRLRLGYTRAGRLIDMLERRGIISGYEGSKPRQVLIGEADVPRILVSLAEGGRGVRERPGADEGDADGSTSAPVSE
ncbi:MAG: DNA translocase FtsK [Solirubrobacteraceae bacterium]